MPRFNSTATRRRNAAALARAKAMQVDQFRDDFASLTAVHRGQLAKLRTTLADTLRVNEVLADALEVLEQENRRLRERYAPIAAMRKRGAAMWFVLSRDRDH